MMRQQTKKAEITCAEQYLSAADHHLGRLIEVIVNRDGPKRFTHSAGASHFEAIAKSIISQQLSAHAAGTIYDRLSTLMGEVTPKRILLTPPENLRTVGLSGQKIRYIRELAHQVESNWLQLEKIESFSDEEITEKLMAITGIGRWTAEMFLMFSLHREDVLPSVDVGLRRGLQLAYGRKNLPTADYLEKAGSKWAPLRSIACLYLWSAIDLSVTRAELHCSK